MLVGVRHLKRLTECIAGHAVTAFVLGVCVIGGLGACSPQAPGGASDANTAAEGADQVAHLDMHDLMNLVLDPATDVLWGAAGTVITLEGSRDLAPTTEEGWQQVVVAAAVVVESGNLLMVPGRAIAEDSWREYSHALSATGKEALVAAQAQDADAIFDIGGRLYNICVACHVAYASDEDPADSAR